MKRRKRLNEKQNHDDLLKNNETEHFYFEKNRKSKKQKLSNKSKRKNLKSFFN